MIRKKMILCGTMRISQEPIVITVNGIRRRGLKVGEYLFLLPHPYGHSTQRKIYKLHDRKPLFPIVVSHDTALRLAEKYIKQYQDFLILWKSYPDMIIHQVVRYTIPDGLGLYEYFESL